MATSLDNIRSEIDALDAELRARFLRRAELVANVAAAKADNGETAPLRPLREIQQLRALIAWQKSNAPMLESAGLIAVWREIIGMALAQQGGLTICASPNAMPQARAHFGASLAYEAGAPKLDNLLENPRLVAVMTLDEAIAPPEGVGVFARLPLIGAPAALCYGKLAASDENDAGAVNLVRRAEAKSGERVIFKGQDDALVETDAPGDDPIWGRYLTLEAEA